MLYCSMQRKLRITCYVTEMCIDTDEANAAGIAVNPHGESELSVFHIE